jgi:hypothetical protein
MGVEHLAGFADVVVDADQDQLVGIDHDVSSRKGASR